MKIEKIYKRIMVCEKKERDFLEVGNIRTANRYHNEIQKWEELLNQLNPKMEKEIIYDKTSEEYKAIKLLENKTTNYSDDNLILHYNTILYNLIINLMKENKKQQEIIDKAIDLLKHQIDILESKDMLHNGEDELLQILEDKEG